MSEEQIGATEYDGTTTITLENNEAALVIGTEEYQVYLPKMENDEDIPVYVLLLSGIAIMLADDKFVDRVLEIVDAELVVD